MGLEVAPLAVLGRVVVPVADVKRALRVTHADLAHRRDPLVDPEEVLLRDDPHGLDHHEESLVVLGTLHVVRDTHGEDPAQREEGVLQVASHSGNSGVPQLEGWVSPASQAVGYPLSSGVLRAATIDLITAPGSWSKLGALAV